MVGCHDLLILVYRCNRLVLFFPNADSVHKTTSEALDDTKEQPPTSDVPIDVTDFSLPDPPDNFHDSLDPADPASKRLSNISSDFDSGERSSATSSGHHQDSGGEREDASLQPQLMIVHVTKEGSQEKHEAHPDSSCATRVTQENSSIKENSATSPKSCVTEADICTGPEGDVTLGKTDELSVSPSSANVSEDTLSANSSPCMDSVSLSTSTMMEDHDISAEHVPLSPEKSLSSDYLPDIYSNTPINISDATLSDGSVETSHRSKTRPKNLSGVGSPPSLKAGGDAQTDSEGTPPASLDSEGAEELSDTASWSRTLSNRSMSDPEIVNQEDAPPLERSLSSTGSGSSQSRSPGSTKQGLRLLADSWAEYYAPGQGYFQFVAVSDTHIWCVTTHDHIYYCPTHFSVVTWTQLRGSARMIAVNDTGDVIWCIDRKNCAHARTEVNANRLTGKKWQPVDKDMRYVTVERSAVWGIKVIAVIPRLGGGEGGGRSFSCENVCLKIYTEPQTTPHCN